MFELVLGRQMSGKSTYCLKKAEALALQGEKVIYIVPEQFTFETQKKLLGALGPAVFNCIEILSLTGLCNEIGKRFGGLSARNVDDGIRFILVRRAIKQVSDNLRHYYKYVNSADFAKQMLSVLGEFKTAAVNIDELLFTVENMEKTIFSDKLYDICIILKAYDSLLGSKFVDPFDIIEKTVNILPDNSFFFDKTVIIDEFKGFTEAQYSLLERIIGGSKETVVSFGCDSLQPLNDTEIFANIKKSALRLKSMAENCKIEVKETYLKEIYYNSADIKRLEAFLAEKPANAGEQFGGDIIIAEQQNPKSEVEYCFKTIRRLVREENLQFKDCVIVSRNEDPYRELINLASKTYKVPCFVDTRVQVSALPLSVFMLSALKAAVSFDSEDIIKMLKTGLTFLSSDEVNELENYTYVWSVNGSGWKSKWLQNPNGLTEACDGTDNCELNGNREKIVASLSGLYNSLNGSAENACRGVLRFFDEMGTINALKLYTAKLEELERFQEAEQQRSGYEVIIKTFDKIVELSSENLTWDEFYDMLSSSLSFETVGEIPQTNDQVIFGTADRIRTVAPKVVFVVGVNQDIFPAGPGDGGLLSSLERTVLKDSGFEISDRALDDSIDENYLFYYACTLGTDRLYFTYLLHTLSGDALLPAAVLESIEEHFGLKEYAAPSNGDITMADIETKEAAFMLLGKYSNSRSPIIAELKNYFKTDADFADRLACFEIYTDAPSRSITKESVDKLYSDEITLSATKIENFNTCRFMHFCRYSLGLNTLNKVDFNALTRGNIVHYCLEKFVSAHFNDIGTLNDELIESETAKLCEQYLEINGADKSVLGERFMYMLKALKQTAFYVAVALNREFSQSNFKPKACEFKIGGYDGEIPSVKVKTNAGRSVGIRGSVDRVDVSQNGDLRVIDYKSNNKTFKIADLLNGLNMQMLIYLYSIIKNGRDCFAASNPAAVLYFNTSTDARLREQPEYIKMNGLVLSDPEVIKQMEQNADGKIIPASLKKDGEISANSSVVSKDVFEIIFRYLDHSLQIIGSELERGDISASAFYENNSYTCDRCDYRLFCRAQKSEIVKEKKDCKNDRAVEELLREMGEI